MEVLNFIKMQGAGNNFIVFNDIEEKFKDLGSLSNNLCNRAFGVGGDGILVVRNSTVADIQMIIINSDGSYASMCGNGLRCFAKYVYENKLVSSTTFDVETGDGIKRCELTLQGDEVVGVRINMGMPSYEPSDIPALSSEEIINRHEVIDGKEYSLNTVMLGVPHTVIITEEGKFNVNEEGPKIEKYKLFPEGSNVNFARIVERDQIKVDTWERGAGATLACGTGCCSCVVVLNRLGLVDKEVTVIAPGGILKVELEDEGVMMTGPAVNVFKGQIKI